MAGRRVWWVGLPSQRGYLYRRLAQQGAVLGLEFLSAQQVYYRLLARALKLKPLVKQTGRIAMVGEALLMLHGELPAPGEARLFSYAIAEAKRYGVRPADIRADDGEVQRFKEVYARYEQVKGEQWDYDDFRSEALRLAERGEADPEAELIVVDGFREIGPLELRLYKALARRCEVWLSLPEAPPGEVPTETLPPREGTRVSRYRAANPVSEARWVLRALKRDLAEGMDPLDIAVVLPERELRAFTALADEYGVPLMDESPRALADTLPGRILLDLLEIPDYPTASRLLAVPELAPLANAALSRGVAGMEAVSVLAAELDARESWQEWLALLEVPDDDEVTWAEMLLDTALPRIRSDLVTLREPPWEAFKDYALQRAQEATRVGKGVHFRKWWAALLQETSLPTRPEGGVAVLSAKLVSGRHFRRAYLLHAVEGAYTTGEGEDYFIVEDERQPLEQVFAKLGLPRRFLGRDEALYQELLTRADEVIVTYPEADQDGPNVRELGLVGEEPPGLPELLAASRLELPQEASYRASVEPVELGSVTLQQLKRYSDCAFRFWAEGRIESDEERPWWLSLISDLRAHARLNPARLEVLKGRYPEAATWLAEHRKHLAQLTFGVTLPEVGEGPKAYLDAALRRASEVTFYRFTAPGRIKSMAEAASYLDDRWNELWAAGHMLDAYGGRVTRVDVVVWPVLGEPIHAFEGGITYLWRRIVSRQEKARAAYQRFSRGEVSPNPGFRCRECRVFDVCREGKR
jgi:ATP-dependent helicase/nuclease subunit B